MSHGAQGVGLAGAGQPEGQHVDAPVQESSAGQSVQLLPQRQGYPVVLEGLPSLARRQSRDAVRSLPMRRCLRSSASCSSTSRRVSRAVAVAGGSEAGHRLLTHGGQPELVAQLPDPLLYGCGVRHQATSASRES